MNYEINRSFLDFWKKNIEEDSDEPEIEIGEIAYFFKKWSENNFILHLVINKTIKYLKHLKLKYDISRNHYMIESQKKII